MKYFTYLTISILTIAVVSLFYLKNPNGQPWLSKPLVSEKLNTAKHQLVAFSNSVFDTVDGSIKKVAENMTPRSENKIYKWQDEQGLWHFSDAPRNYGSSEEVKLNSKNITVIVAEDTSILNGSAKSSRLDFPSAAKQYDPEAIKKLFKDAEKAKQKLEQRSKEIENSSGF